MGTFIGDALTGFFCILILACGIIIYRTNNYAFVIPLIVFMYCGYQAATKTTNNRR